MRVDIVKIDRIAGVGRAREDMGDLYELARSIKEKGLIQPLAVEDNEDETYNLLAGGRRLEACKLAELELVPVRIYDHGLSGLERKSIELEENIRRKDLTYQEEVYLTREIHRLQVQIHGEPHQGARTDLEYIAAGGGHSLRDTANMLGRAVGGVSEDVRLADAMEVLPEAGWDKCKNKSEAMRLLDRIEESEIRRELSERAVKAARRKDTKLADLYLVGDFFELVKNVPDGIMDIVEVDPPYGIDLTKVKKNNLEIKLDTSYVDVPSKEYVAFLEHVAAECWRIMNDHSWLVFWFGPEPWFEPVFQVLTNQGFRGRRMPGIWLKSGMGGQTYQPDIYLGNLYEMFFYMYKGDGCITSGKRGRSNVFPCAVVPPQYKIHDTERPIPLMEEILSTFAYEGARLFVPFAGSGNTIRAGLNLNMSPLGCDVGQEYKENYVLRLVADGLM